MTMAFLPVYHPWRMTTIRPVLMNFPIASAAAPCRLLARGKARSDLLLSGLRLGPKCLEP